MRQQQLSTRINIAYIRKKSKKKRILCQVEYLDNNLIFLFVQFNLS